jgi:hypothetical protein
VKEVHKAVTQHQIRMMSVENFWLPSGQSTGCHLVNQHLRSLHAHHQNRHQGMQTFLQASMPGQNNKDQASHPIMQGQCQDAVICAQVLTWLIYSKIFCRNHAGQHSQMYISHFSQKLNASLPNQGLPVYPVDLPRCGCLVKCGPRRPPGHLSHAERRPALIQYSLVETDSTPLAWFFHQSHKTSDPTRKK